MSWEACSSERGQRRSDQLWFHATLLEAKALYALIFSSTAAVYGEPQVFPMSESHRFQPINPYGATKRRVEQALERNRAAYGHGAIALRYFNAAGCRSRRTPEQPSFRREPRTPRST